MCCPAGRAGWWPGLGWSTGRSRAPGQGKGRNTGRPSWKPAIGFGPAEKGVSAVTQWSLSRWVWLKWTKDSWNGQHCKVGSDSSSELRNTKTNCRKIGNVTPTQFEWTFLAWQAGVLAQAEPDSDSESETTGVTMCYGHSDLTRDSESALGPDREAPESG